MASSSPQLQQRREIREDSIDSRQACVAAQVPVLARLSQAAFGRTALHIHEAAQGFSKQPDTILSKEGQAVIIFSHNLKATASLK
jgi:hypothetical protein